MSSLKKLLLVEDNHEFSDAALSTAKDMKSDIIDYRNIVVADCYNSAQNAIFHGIDTAVVDCFFPRAIDLGIERCLAYHTIAEMMQQDPKQPARNRNPITQSLNRIIELMGVEAAQNFAKNSRVDYGSTVDPYKHMEAMIKQDDANQPLGIVIAGELEQKNIPFVLATSTYHHDVMTQPIYDYAGRRNWILIDCPKDMPGQKANPEYWQRVFTTLSAMNEMKNNKEITL